MEQLSALAAQASHLDLPPPHERRAVLRSEAGLLLDGLLARVARGHGALDVAIGEGLAALAEGDRALQLGYSGIGDYARERLGIAARTAQGMARLARELRTRPQLRAAVRSGEISARKAEVVLPVARGDAEARWVARAGDDTVRGLQIAVRQAAAAPSESTSASCAAPVSAAGAGTEAVEDWERIGFPLSPEQRASVDEAMALAGELLGATAPQWQRLEALCQEYLGAHPPGDSPDRPDLDLEEPGLLCGPVADWLGAAKEALELGRWSWLERVAPVAAPVPSAVDVTDPHRIDAELRRLVGLRAGWDEVLGHLAVLVRGLGLWRDMGFASFGHYCAERLGMAVRAVEQRAWLERKLRALPALRQAMRDGRISYEKARAIAACADGGSIGEWIARAEETTCIALRREIDADDEAQMCARGEMAVRAPKRVATLVAAAFRAARRAEARWLSPGECLARIAAHFIATWKVAPKARNTPQRRAIERDGGRCTVPGCSRAATQAHHVRYRSRGGGDEDANLTGLCAPHHLHGVHRGYIQVGGHAPDRLTWTLGVGGDVPTA